MSVFLVGLKNIYISSLFYQKGTPLVSKLRGNSLPRAHDSSLRLEPNAAPQLTQTHYVRGVAQNCLLLLVGGVDFATAKDKVVCFQTTSIALRHVAKPGRKSPFRFFLAKNICDS